VIAVIAATVEATAVTGAVAALAPHATVVEVLAVTTRSTPTPPAATTVSASAKTHTLVGRGAMIGALSVEAATVEVETVLGAIPTLGATALEETVTAMMTVATDGTGETATTGAATGSRAVTAGAGEADVMEALAADVIGRVSRRKSLRHSTSRVRPHPISLPSRTSRSASAV
jgi:chemotaxis protein histidine kinase CheA